MSDRGFCFLFSCAVILASLGATGWLLATGQAATVDGLFLMLMCLTVAAGFALYVMRVLSRRLRRMDVRYETGRDDRNEPHDIG